MLDAGGDLPVGHPVTPSAEQIGIVGVARYDGAEVAIDHRTAEVAAAAAQILLDGIRQRAVGPVVLIRIRPRSRRVVDVCVHRIRIDAQRIERLAQQVFVDRDLQRRLPVAAQVIGQAGAIRQVLPAEIGPFGEGDIARRHQLAGTEVLLGEARAEVVVAEREVEREAVHRPAILREQAEVVVEMVLGHVRRREEGDLVRHAVVEAELVRLEVVGAHIQVTVRAVEPDLEAVRARHVRHRGAIRKVWHRGVVIGRPRAVGHVGRLLEHRDHLRERRFLRGIVQRAAVHAQVHVAPPLVEVHADRFEQQLVAHRRAPFQMLLPQAGEPPVGRRLRRTRRG